jgi:hypothetical protein
LFGVSVRHSDFSRRSNGAKQRHTELKAEAQWLTLLGAREDAPRARGDGESGTTYWGAVSGSAGPLARLEDQVPLFDCNLCCILAGSMRAKVNFNPLVAPARRTHLAWYQLRIPARGAALSLTIWPGSACRRAPASTTLD